MNAATTPPRNRLAREKSPYLLQHAGNPVDWQPWDAAAFAEARRRSCPVFLSIGYSTCHWCHVMERETFEDPAVGAFLREHFVSIKVDREERPDVDKIYMTFVQATTGSGGWPLSVFLTPDLKPFFGGTYFPPEPRHGRPSFLELLRQIAALWRERPAELQASAAELQTRLEQFTARDPAPDEPLTPEILRHAAAQFQAAWDPVDGGFGAAPKFPQPGIPRLLLRTSVRFGGEPARGMVWQTCDRMADGGIHDQLGGGFARYAVDAAWHVPHFEKMLYDNAQLAQLYLESFVAGGPARHAEVARGILDYVLRDLTHPDGGFFSAEDADSEGHEGKFYCWTEAELARLLTPEELAAATDFYGLTAGGNFVDHSHPSPLPGLNVLRVAGTAGAGGAPLASARAKMLAARALRARPLRDDKVLASWNGLMLGACARAGMILNEPRFQAAALKNWEFLRRELWDAGRQTLFHRWREGERDRVELLEGHAFVLEGTLHLYETTLEPAHLEFALQLAESMLTRFYDARQGGFWQTVAGADDLILRLKDDYDGAEPSGNSVAVLALLKLGVITGREKFTHAAQATLRLFAHRLQTQPAALASMLQALDFYLDEPGRVVIGGQPGSPEFQALLRAAHSVHGPNRVVLGTTGAVEPFAGSLRSAGPATAWVCTGRACQPPASHPDALRAALRA